MVRLDDFQSTEGEIKYILFIAYLDAPRDPRGVKTKDVPLSTELEFESLVF